VHGNRSFLTERPHQNAVAFSKPGLIYGIYIAAVQRTASILYAAMTILYASSELLMLDFTFVAGGLAFFVVAIAYTFGLTRL
jgi:hypothetical protein